MQKIRFINAKILTMVDGKILYENGKFNINESLKDIYNECQMISERIDRQVKEEK